MKPSYIQIFSMTDHAKPLNDRYQGNYTGINATLNTSSFDKGRLTISEKTRSPQGGEIEHDAISNSKIILAYRHSDSGVLQGTSESLLAVKSLPWTQMPGLEIHSIDKEGSMQMKLWMQTFTLHPNRMTCVRFGKTIVYLKNYGPCSNLEWNSDALSEGPTHLHKEKIDDEITIAPPAPSALQVKMGQEVEA